MSFLGVERLFAGDVGYTEETLSLADSIPKLSALQAGFLGRIRLPGEPDKRLFSIGYYELREGSKRRSICFRRAFEASLRGARTDRQNRECRVWI